MAKDKISDYSSTANSNTDIAGINIDEGCAPSGINDAIRTLMAQLKTWQSGGQDVYIHPAGTALAPSVTANGDTNTGIFFPAADTVAVTTGGSERARVDSSGNLGLGVTPSAWNSNRKVLQINRASLVGTDGNETNLGSNYYWNGTSNLYIASTHATLYNQGAGAHIWYNAASGTAGNAITWTQAMTLDASGRLGIGRTSPSYLLDVENATQADLRLLATGNVDFLISSIASGLEARFTKTGGSGPITFYNGGSERARIDSSGNLLVNTTSAAGNASTFKSTAGAGQQAVSFWNNATSSTRYFVTFGTEASYTERGYITWNGSTMALSNASDERLKENIVDAPSALPKIAQMQIRSFDFKEDGRHVEYGVVAQELNQVIPAAVFEGADNEDGSINKPWSVGLEPVIPVLVKAIQELKATVDAQAAEIAALKGQA